MECEVCSRSGDARVCVKCQSRMNRQLQDLSEFLYDAGGNLLPGGSNERRSSERGLGVRLDALDFIAGFDVLPTLEDWERDWRLFFGCTAFGPASAERMRSRSLEVDKVAARLRECIKFLQSFLQPACEKHPAISDFASELGAKWRQAQAAAGAQPRTSWRLTCPSDTEEGECGRPIRITGEDFDGTVYCRACGFSWPVERLLRVVASSRHAELWLDPEAAARWFGISSRDLRRWAQRGKIKRRHGRYESHSIRAAISEGVGA